MAVALDPLSELQQQLQQAAADPSLDPTERAIRLRDLRERINDLLGDADRLVANVQQLRESEASAQARQVLWARENADLREELLTEGWEADTLNEAGFLSHVELDRLQEEGLLIEAIVGIAKKFDPLKHPHGGHGRFEDTTGGVRPPAMGHQEAIDERYKHYFKEDPEATIAHVSRLRPTRSESPERVAKARRNLDRGKAGLMEKRAPLDAAENGDGTLSILDGNATHAALTAEGLQHLPVKVNHDVEPGMSDDAAVERVADEMLSTVESVEPTVTSALKRVTTDKGGKLEGLDNRLKTRESLARKIKLKQVKYPNMKPDEAGARITDALRYTAVFPSDGYTDGVKSTLQAAQAAGYKPTMQENYWGGGDDYDGYHVILRGPKGVLAELQFHTPESLKAKTQQNHPIYEKFRSSGDSHERWELWQTMCANTAAIPQPPGVEQLAGSKTHPSPKPPAE